MKDLNIIVKADVQGSAEAVKIISGEAQQRGSQRPGHPLRGGRHQRERRHAGRHLQRHHRGLQRPPRRSVPRGSPSATRWICACTASSMTAIDEIESAMKGMLAPKFKEVELGRAEVRQVYKITGVGIVAGCYVLEGKVTRNAQLRLVRDGIVIHEGEIASLQRFKDSVKEVAAGLRVRHHAGEVLRPEGGRRPRVLRDAGDRTVIPGKPGGVSCKEIAIYFSPCGAGNSVKPYGAECRISFCVLRLFLIRRTLWQRIESIGSMRIFSGSWPA